jgi:hypothetical protein
MTESGSPKIQINRCRKQVIFWSQKPEEKPFRSLLRVRKMMGEKVDYL